MEIDEEELDIQITQTQTEDNAGTVPVLYANIPIKSMRKSNQEDWSCTSTSFSLSFATVPEGWAFFLRRKLKMSIETHPY